MNISNIVAVILAGGMGTRLREVISDRPKVLAELNGKPFIFYILDQLLNARESADLGEMARELRRNLEDDVLQGDTLRLVE